MPKADVATFGARVYVDNVEVTPIKPWLQWIAQNNDGDVYIYTSMHKVAGSASNETISLSEDTNTKLTILWDSSATGSTLTVKLNGSATAQSVKPIRVTSGVLTALTVSNSDSATHYLGIARIVISATNTVLKEVDDAF